MLAVLDSYREEIVLRAAEYIQREARRHGAEQGLAAVTDHEYALNAAGGGKFTLYNPWGYQHLTDVDAAFIKANFQKVRFLTL